MEGCSGSGRERGARAPAQAREREAERMDIHMMHNNLCKKQQLRLVAA
jgi:hypothetical protein